ncbi:hypothetical protein AAG906_016494 [Vitis piasezkii]
MERWVGRSSWFLTVTISTGLLCWEALEELEFSVILSLNEPFLVNLMMFKGMPVSAELDKVPRIGVLPRSASTDSKIRWFEAPGFNAMHAINAWEEGDEEIILVAPNAISIENLVHNIEKVHFSLEKVRINLRNSSVTRTTLSQKNLELGSINPSYVGKRNSVKKAIWSWVLWRRTLDDGYIVSYVHDEKSGASRFVVMDAKSQTLDVVATVKLPRRVPYGFHGLL